MKNLLYIFILLFALNVSGQNTYYVTTSGSSSNSGADEANAWSLSHAFSTAQAGDVVYIKAGTYTTNYTISNSGTENNTITFIGYSSTPNDVVDTETTRTEGSKTISRTNLFWHANSGTSIYGSSSDASAMPLLSRPIGVDNGTTLSVSGDYINIKNIQIEGNRYGLYVNGNYCTIENIYTFSQNCNGNGSTYFGNSIYNFGSYNTWNNIAVFNADAQGFSIRGDYSTYNNIGVFCDITTDPQNTDYYFLFQEGHDNTATNIYVGRYMDGNHYGHGLVFKTAQECYNNVVDGFIVQDCNIELQFPGVHDNTVKNGYASNLDYLDNVYAWHRHGINLANGSYDNIFDNIELPNCGIRFADWDDGLSGDVADSSDGNVFNQILSYNSRYAICGDYFNSLNTNDWSGAFDNNTFYNCTFYNAIDLWLDNRANSNTNFINCIFDTLTYAQRTGAGAGNNYSFDASYTNTNFSNLGFTTPSGTNITTTTDIFKNAVSGDFSLTATSPLNDTGIATPFLSTGNDIGAVQDGSSTTPPPTDTTAPILTTISDSATSNSISIDWYLDEGSTGRIEWGTDASFGSFSTLETRYLTHHIQTITGLNSGTQYYYRVLGEDAAGNVVTGATRTISTTLSAPNRKQRANRDRLIMQQ